MDWYQSSVKSSYFADACHDLFQSLVKKNKLNGLTFIELTNLHTSSSLSCAARLARKSLLCFIAPISGSFKFFVRPVIPVCRELGSEVVGMFGLNWVKSLIISMYLFDIYTLARGAFHCKGPSKVIGNAMHKMPSQPAGYYKCIIR